MGHFFKQYRDVINYLLTGMNTIFILILILFYFSKLSPAVTGTIGDTFGGLFSPVIGLVSIYYIFKTFNEQRNQYIDTQKLQNQENQRLKNKEQVDRVTEIIYRQLERIDDNLRSHSFIIGLESIGGRRGLYTLNTSLNHDLSYINALDEADQRWLKALDRLREGIERNIDPLVDYFDHIFISLAVINTTITNAKFDDLKDEKETLRLFFLNLSASFEEMITRYRKILNLINDNFELQENGGTYRLYQLIEDIFNMTTININKVTNE